MKKCSEHIKDIADYMSKYGDVEIFIENDLIQQDCKHDGKIHKKFNIYTEGYELSCVKCGDKIGHETCYGRTVMYGDGTRK